MLSDLHSVACIGLHLHLDWIRACGRYSCMAGSSSAVAAFTEMVRSEVLSGGSQCCARGPARTHSTCTTRELGGTGHRAQDLRWDGATTAPHRGSSLPPASRQSCTASPAGMDGIVQPAPCMDHVPARSRPLDKTNWLQSMVLTKCIGRRLRVTGECRFPRCSHSCSRSRSHSLMAPAAARGA